MARLNQKKAQRRPLIEWIIGAISGILTLALLGFLLVRGIVREPQGPELSVSVTSLEFQAEGFAARIELVNGGDAAASAISVEGTLPSGASSAIEFDYIAGGATRRGTLQFTDTDPAGLKLRVTGHVDP